MHHVSPPEAAEAASGAEAAGAGAIKAPFWPQPATPRQSGGEGGTAATRARPLHSNDASLILSTMCHDSEPQRLSDTEYAAPERQAMAAIEATVDRLLQEDV